MQTRGTRSTSIMCFISWSKAVQQTRCMHRAEEGDRVGWVGFLSLHFHQTLAAGKDRNVELEGGIGVRTDRRVSLNGWRKALVGQGSWILTCGLHLTYSVAWGSAGGQHSTAGVCAFVANSHERAGQAQIQCRFAPRMSQRSTERILLSQQQQLK